MTPALSVHDLCVQFSHRGGLSQGVGGVSLTLQPGKVLGLVGASGSGKSLTALSAVRLLPEGCRVTGRVEVGGVDVGNLEGAALRRFRGSIGVVFQDPSTALNPVFRVGAQVAEGVRLHQPAAEARTLARDALAEVGLSGLQERFPHELSGGQRQRVVLAMALVNRPALLVADEPTTALDAVVAAELIELLGRLVRERRMSMLLTSHDARVIRALADEVVVLDRGLVVASGGLEVLPLPPRAPPRETGVVRTSSLSASEVAVSYAPALRLWRRAAPALALAGVSLRLRRGETLGLVGASGSGKSTFARAILGLLPLAGGRVELDGTPIVDRREFCRRVQPVFQDPASALDPRFTVVEAIEEARAAGGRSAGPDAAQLLREVGLPESLLSRLPHELSGGERQRVLLARALAVDPEFLVLDECVSSLDAHVQAEVLVLLDRLQARRALGILFISHDLRLLAARADRVAVMHEGRVVEEGPCDQVFSAPKHPVTRTLLVAAGMG